MEQRSSTVAPAVAVAPGLAKLDELNFEMDPKRILTSPMLQDPTHLIVNMDPNRSRFRQGFRYVILEKTF